MLPSLTLPVNTFFQTFFSSSFGALSISSASVSSGRPPSRGVLCDINLSLPSCQHFFRNFLKNFFASFFPGFYPPLSSDWVPNLLLLSALMRFPWFQSVTCLHVMPAVSFSLTAHSSVSALKRGRWLWLPSLSDHAVYCCLLQLSDSLLILPRISFPLFCTVHLCSCF